MRWQLLLVLQVLGCSLMAGCSRHASQPAKPVDPKPARVAAPPDAAAAPPVSAIVPYGTARSASSPDGGNSACTLLPAGGMVLIKNRSLPAVELGRSGAIITHRSPNRSHAVTGPHEIIHKPRKNGQLADNADCTWHDGYVAVGLPLGLTAPRVLYDPNKDDECEQVYDSPLPANLGGEAVLTNCYDHGTTGGYGYWACEIDLPFSGGKVLKVGTKGDHHMTSPNESAAAWDIKSRDGVLFIAALFKESSIYGVVIRADGKLTERQLDLPKEDYLEYPARGSIKIQPLSTKEALVTVAPPNQEVDSPDDKAMALQLTFTDKVRRVGPIRRLRAAPPPSDSAAVQLGVAPRIASQPPHVIMRRGGKVQAVSGLGEAATFSPELLDVDGQKILLWSAGLGKSTSIRAARFDVNSGAVIGPVTTVSADGREAGFVSGGAFQSRAVIAWEQQGANTTWEIRVAELTCPRVEPGGTPL